MKPFRPATITLSGKIPIAAGPAEAFPLFSPEGEKRWVPGWAPELLYPPGVPWAAGQIFRTQEEKGEAVWVVTRLDDVRCEVEYHRVEPGRYVAHIVVRCEPAREGGSEASVVYSFIGLSEAGNREIAAMSREEYGSKMARWREWIGRHLAASGKA